MFGILDFFLLLPGSNATYKTYAFVFENQGMFHTG